MLVEQFLFLYNSPTGCGRNIWGPTEEIESLLDLQEATIGRCGLDVVRGE